MDLATFGSSLVGTKTIGTKPILPKRKSNAHANKWKRQPKATWLLKHWTGIKIIKGPFLEWYCIALPKDSCFPSFNHIKPFCNQDRRGLSQTIKHRSAEKRPRCYYSFPGWISRSSSCIRCGLGSCLGYELANLYRYRAHYCLSFNVSLSPFKFQFLFLFHWRLICKLSFGFSVWWNLLHQYLRLPPHESLSGWVSPNFSHTL